MLITAEQLQSFSNTYREDDDTTKLSLLNIYIGSAQEVISGYLGYNPETADRFKVGDTYVIPDSIKFVCLEIATLMQMEESNNIGINSKSFGESGSRSFLNVVDYSKYLKRISQWRDVNV